MKVEMCAARLSDNPKTARIRNILKLQCISNLPVVN
jgi:hypothetical protein